jgi:surface protein
MNSNRQWPKLLFGLWLFIGQTLMQAQVPIYTWQDLHEVRNNLSGHYRLMNDLGPSDPGYQSYAGDNANGGLGWEPIGTLSNRFSGTFDGQGYTLVGIRMNRPNSDYIGLFGVVSGGVIHDLTLTNLNGRGRDKVGGLAGAVIGATGASFQWLFRACRVSGSIEARNEAGGLVGSVSGTQPLGMVAVHSVLYLVGGNQVGGLVGVLTTTQLLVLNASSATTCEGLDAVGGFLGHANNAQLNIRNSLSYGVVQGSLAQGGVVGKNTGGSYQHESVYWDKTTSQQQTTAQPQGITGLTTAEMRGLVAAEFMTALDFQCVWEVNEFDYPFLKAPEPMALIFETTTASSNISLPLSGTVAVRIDWGDGLFSDVNTAGIVNHTYADPGQYMVQIYYQLTQFGAGTAQWPNAEKLIEVVSFGCTSLRSLSGAFREATQLGRVPGILPAGLTNLSNTFHGATALDKDISQWDVSQVTDMSNMMLNAGLSRENYDALLISWSEQSLQTSVSFHAGNSIYTCGQEAEAARWRLINEYGWSIADGGSSTLEQSPDNYDFILDANQPLGEEMSLGLLVFQGTELLNFNGRISMRLIRSDGSVADESFAFALKGVAVFQGLLLDEPGQYTLQAGVCDQQYQGESLPIETFQMYGGGSGDGHALATFAACLGGGQVTNEDTGAAFCKIQEAIDNPGTLPGHTLTISGATYDEDINTNQKQLRLVPGPGCVDITGGLSLSPGDEVSFFITGADACTGVPQLRVDGLLQLNGATLIISDTELSELTLMSSTATIAGAFSNGTLISNAIRSYQVSYGTEVRLTPCCQGQLDLGIFPGVRAPDGAMPAGHKLEIRVRPQTDVNNGIHAAGIFTLRTLSDNNLVFTNLGGAAQPYALVNTEQDGVFTYYFFSFEMETPVSWQADQEYTMLWLAYDCSIVEPLIELSDDAFTLANNGGYYQEIGPVDGPFVAAQGIFYSPVVVGPSRLTLSSNNDGPVCTSMPLSLSATVAGGSPDYSYHWTGPEAFTSTAEAPVLSNLMLAQAGIYQLVVTDGNGCQQTTETPVMIVPQLSCVYNETQETYFSTINRAIGDQQTQDGDVLYIPPGSYAEEVMVTKSINLVGNNAGIACAEGIRDNESIVDAAMGTGFLISADGVSIRGFHIKAGFGIRSSGVSGLTLSDNRVEALQEGIVVTASQDMPLMISDNCVELAAQAYTHYTFEQLEGDWYAEPYVPGIFEVAAFDGDNRLKLGILADDCSECRPVGFRDELFDTQGMAKVVFGAQGVSAAVYVPVDWEATLLPRLAFSVMLREVGGSTDTHAEIRLVDGAWYGWDGQAWVLLSREVTYGSWSALYISVNQQILSYVVDNQRLDLSLATELGIHTMALQGFNSEAGEQYDIFWDDVYVIGGTVSEVNRTTRAIALSGISGSAPALLMDNHLTNAWYGYHVYDVKTEQRSLITGGVGSGLIQGIVVLNTLDDESYAGSSLSVSSMTLSAFSGSYETMGELNFQAGVYGFAGGVDTSHAIDLLFYDVQISGTGYSHAHNAGIVLEALPGGTKVKATVRECTIAEHENAGLIVTGPGAELNLENSIVQNNGSNPAVGVGYGILVSEDGLANITGNVISNPLVQSSGTVVALAVDGTGARLYATENHVGASGSGSLTANPGDIADFQATCNWWGSGFVNDVDDALTGNVLFIPFLREDSDVEPLLAGYQPAAEACRNPERWYVNNLEETSDIYTFTGGNDESQGTRHRPFSSMGKALSVAVASDTILVDAGLYDETLQIPATLTNIQLWGAGPCGDAASRTVLDFSGALDPSATPVLLDIQAQGVVVDGMAFSVNLSRMNGAIRASAGVTLSNNCFDPYLSLNDTYFGDYAERNAVLIQDGVSVVIDQNQVNGDEQSGFFRTGFSLRRCDGLITRNMVQASGRDLEMLEVGAGILVLGGSQDQGNQWLGGGVLLTNTVAGTGSVEISYNLFSGALVAGDTALLVCRDNIGQTAVHISENAFNDLRWGLSLENFNHITVADNTFRPAASAVDFRLITVNTKSISASYNAVPRVVLDATFTGNEFYSNYPVAGGTALAFYNHDSEEADIGTITLGTADAPNTFADGFGRLVYLGDEQGSTAQTTGFPEYQLSGAPATLMDCWPRDIDFQQNLIDVGAGTQLPSLMNHEQRLMLEDLLYHDVDNACLGTLVYFIPAELAIRVMLQGAYNPVSGRMNDHLRSQGLIPLEEPHTAIASQFPASFTPVPHHLTEVTTPQVLAVSGPNAIVDWIWVELRSPSTPETILATRSGLLQADGDVVDVDGISPLIFGEAYIGRYHVMVRHRNHLGAMTAVPIDIGEVGAFVDFSSANMPTFGPHGLSARRALASGVLGLYAGNTLPRAQVEISPGVFSPGFIEIKYNGQNNDRVPILNAVGSSNPLQVIYGVYALEDVNLDGQIKYNGQSNDRVMILNNVGASTPLNFIRQTPDN